MEEFSEEFRQEYINVDAAYKDDYDFIYFNNHDGDGPALDICEDHYGKENIINDPKYLEINGYYIIAEVRTNYNKQPNTLMLVIPWCLHIGKLVEINEDHAVFIVGKTNDRIEARLPTRYRDPVTYHKIPGNELTFSIQSCPYYDKYRKYCFIKPKEAFTVIEEGPPVLKGGRGRRRKSRRHKSRRHKSRRYKSRRYRHKYMR